MNDREVQNILLDLESEDMSLRTQAIQAAAKLGERAVPCLGLLRRIAVQDVAEVAFLARRCLFLLQQQTGTAPAAGGGKLSTGQTFFIAQEGPLAIATKLEAKDPALRASTLRAAALKRDPSLLPFVLRRATPGVEPDPEVRCVQPAVLATLAGQQALPHILKLLEDGDPRVRIATLECLSQLGHPPVWVHVAGCLRDKDQTVVSCAGRLLQKIGKLNILRLCGHMLKPDQKAQVRDNGAYMLAVAKLPEAVPLLEQALKDGQEEVRSKALAGLRKLGELGVEAATAVVAKASASKVKEESFAFSGTIAHATEDITSQDVAIRRRESLRLAKQGILDAGVLPHVLEQLKVEKDDEVIRNLLRAVIASDDASTLPTLRTFLTHKSEDARAAAIDAVATGGPHALGFIVPLLDDASPDVRAKAILKLKSHPYVDVAKPLQAMAEHKDARFRKSAVYVISELGDPKYRHLLDALTCDDNSHIAELAAETARMLGGEIAPAASTTSPAAPSVLTRPVDQSEAPQRASGTMRTPKEQTEQEHSPGPQQATRRVGWLTIPLALLLVIVVACVAKYTMPDLWLGAQTPQGKQPAASVESRPVPARNHENAGRSGATPSHASERPCDSEIKTWADFLREVQRDRPSRITQMRLARFASNVRACYANQKAVAGAMEMYNLDKSTKLTTLNEKVLEVLKSGGYLPSIPGDPGQGPDTSDHYVHTTTGNGIRCAVHGEIQSSAEADTSKAHQVSGSPASEAVPPSEPGVTMANYQKLKTGMTYEDVVQVLGQPGTEMSRAEVMGVETVMYSWESGSGGANMTAMFEDGRLMTKGQVGLK